MPINTYSSGMRARLSFGLSIAFNFDVYLIDELTSVGDAIFREKAKAAFEKIRKRASLIYISHNLKALRESCQTALFLRDGKADFFEDIQDGIEAYTQYIREHRNHGKPKTIKAANRQRRLAKKKAARRAERLRQAESQAESQTGTEAAQEPGADA
jgi:capsular polysaccharide transport system ATP-binding protein